MDYRSVLRLIAAVGTTLLLLSNTVSAGVILSPISVIGNTMGENGSTYRVSYTIDQSGLSAAFASGVTDFSTYIGGGPTHGNTSGVGDIGWASGRLGSLPGHIDYDLGANFNILQVAIWPEDTLGIISGITLFTADNPSFIGAVNVGTFAVSDPPDDVPVSAQVFDLTDSSGRYVRFQIDSVVANALDIAVLSEIAFDVTANNHAVPEPGTLALLGLSLAGLAVSRRRKQ